LYEVHETSRDHRTEIECSNVCGCFYCGAVFDPGRITDWTDEDEQGVEQTALCPRCGIDSVIGDGAGWIIDRQLLDEMSGRWFAGDSIPELTYLGDVYHGHVEYENDCETGPPSSRAA